MVVNVEMGMVNKIDKEVTVMLIIVAYSDRAYTYTLSSAMTGIDIWIMGVPHPTQESLVSMRR